MTYTDTSYTDEALAAALGREIATVAVDRVALRQAASNVGRFAGDGSCASALQNVALVFDGEFRLTIMATDTHAAARQVVNTHAVSTTMAEELRGKMAIAVYATPKALAAATKGSGTSSDVWLRLMSDGSVSADGAPLDAAPVIHGGVWPLASVTRFFDEHQGLAAEGVALSRTIMSKVTKVAGQNDRPLRITLGAPVGARPGPVLVTCGEFSTVIMPIIVT